MLARLALLFPTAFLCFACAEPPGEDPGAPPNIVLLIGDDHGYPDFGFMGSEVAHTPNLDQLAREGTVFRVAYNTASVCRPSLNTLLTGLHPEDYELRRQLLAKLQGDSRQPLTSRLDTLPRALGRAGYASFQSGKRPDGAILAMGFTDYMENAGGRRAGKLGMGLVRMTMDPVLEFIDAHADEPFFLWFAPAIPHLPHDAPRPFWEPYRDLDLIPTERAYFASVSWFDWSVGKLVEHLEERGIRERTLLVYLSDNGWDPRPSKSGDAWLGGPAGKRTLHELGFRTPIVFHLPGRVPAGASHDVLVSTVDLLPTLLDFAGAPPIEGVPGTSLRPLVEGGSGKTREAIVGSMDWLQGDAEDAKGGFFVRTRRWHYLLYNRGGQALYDVEADPREDRDVADRHPEVVAGARARIRDFADEVRRTAESGARALFDPRGS